MKNIKTTACGLGGALLIVVTHAIETGGFTWSSLGMALTVAALGFFAKDASNVTTQATIQPK